MKVHRLSDCTWNLFQRSIEWHRHKNLFGAKCLRISFGIIKSIYIQSILCYRWLKVLISFSLKSSVDFLVVLVEICGFPLLAITQHQLPFRHNFFLSEWSNSSSPIRSSSKLQEFLSPVKQCDALTCSSSS